MNAINSSTPNGLLAAQSASLTRLQSLGQKLSSGRAINSALDNAAGLAQSSSFSVQLSSTAVAMQGLQDGSSLVQTASGALGEVSSNLQQLNDLAVQAGNGSLSASDRQALQAQASQLTQNLNQISGNTQFNGQNLLDGSFSANLQTGPNAGDTQSLSLGSVSANALGLGSVDLTSSSGQASAMQAISQALQQVNDQQAGVGASQSGLQANFDQLSAQSGALASSNASLSDADLAQAASSFSQEQVRQTAATRMLSLYQSMQKDTLSLLPK